MSAPELSTKPYFIRAVHEWCMDSGFTPYIAVMVDSMTRVPREYVRDGQIVLNVSMDATGSLVLGNESIEFSARFSGVSQKILIPVSRVAAIYARENGVGMGFEVEESQPASTEIHPVTDPVPHEVSGGPGKEDEKTSLVSESSKPRPGRPHLQRIK